MAYEKISLNNESRIQINTQDNKLSLLCSIFHSNLAKKKHLQSIKKLQRQKNILCIMSFPQMPYKSTEAYHFQKNLCVFWRGKVTFDGKHFLYKPLLSKYFVVLYFLENCLK